MDDSGNLEALVAFVPALLAVLLVARLCGAAAERLGQPRVVGEMVAGVLLGPSVLGALAPAAADRLFTADVRQILYVLSTVGLTLYMLLVGLEVRHGGVPPALLRRAGVVAAAGIVPVFLLGLGAGFLLAPSLSLPDVPPGIFALFLACALSVTAFPMLARVLGDEGIAGTRLGTLVLLAAAGDDVVAWCFLALVTALVGAGSGTAVGATLGGGVALAALMVGPVRWALRPLGARAARAGQVDQSALAAVVLLVLATAWLAEVVGIHAVFGGFVAGLALPTDETFRTDLRRRLLDVVVVLLVPLFFAHTGLSTRIDGLTSPQLLVPLLLLLAIACLGKYGGCALAARAVGHDWREAAAIGALMNARGLMELIILDVGLSYGLISQDVFSLLVVMAVVTTAGAVPAFRLALPGGSAPALAPAGADPLQEAVR